MSELNNFLVYFSNLNILPIFTVIAGLIQINEDI